MARLEGATGAAVATSCGQGWMVWCGGVGGRRRGGGRGGGGPLTLQMVTRVSRKSCLSCDTSGVSGITKYVD